MVVLIYWRIALANRNSSDRAVTPDRHAAMACHSKAYLLCTDANTVFVPSALPRPICRRLQGPDPIRARQLLPSHSPSLHIYTSYARRRMTAYAALLLLCAKQAIKYLNPLRPTPLHPFIPLHPTSNPTHVVPLFTLLLPSPRLSPLASPHLIHITIAISIAIASLSHSPPEIATTSRCSASVANARWHCAARCWCCAARVWCCTPTG